MKLWFFERGMLLIFSMTDGRKGLISNGPLPFTTTTIDGSITINGNGFEISNCDIFGTSKIIGKTNLMNIGEKTFCSIKDSTVGRILIIKYAKMPLSKLMEVLKWKVTINYILSKKIFRFGVLKFDSSTNNFLFKP